MALCAASVAHAATICEGMALDPVVEAAPAPTLRFFWAPRPADPGPPRLSPYSASCPETGPPAWGSTSCTPPPVWGATSAPADFAPQAGG